MDFTAAFDSYAILEASIVLMVGNHVRLYRQTKSNSGLRQTWLYPYVVIVPIPVDVGQWMILLSDIRLPHVPQDLCP